MSGILRYGSYIPFYRLDRQAAGIGRGDRAIASYDEDSVSMAVEAGRQALDTAVPDTLIFATTSPPYAEKLNAAAIAAALDLPSQTRSVELGSNSRMGLSGLSLACDLAAAGRTALLCAGDVVIGAPGGARERDSGDAAVAFVTGPAEQAIARVLGSASATSEVLDVWRTPEAPFAKQWEERFGVEVLGPVSLDTAKRALAAAGVEPTSLAKVVLDATNRRDLAAIPKALGLRPEQLTDPLVDSVGRSGTAHAGLMLAQALDAAAPGDRILVLSTASPSGPTCPTTPT